MADATLPDGLSAKYTGSFAYQTVKDRLPVILTKVIDTLYSFRKQASQKYGEAATEDCKTIVSHLAKLKNEMQTNKPITSLTDPTKDDIAIWNAYFEAECNENGGKAPTWFESTWLYVECYMYRKIMETIHTSNALQSFDPFGEQKRNALLQSLNAVSLLANFLEEHTGVTGDEVQKVFGQFVQISLWGNKCDLSVSAGVENSQKIDPLGPLQTLQANILVNDIHKLWALLTEARKNNPTKKVRLDIVLDNAGFELFTDLCLAEFAIRTSIADVVHMHYKAMPWFVSDVTYQDFMWTIDTLHNHRDNVLSSLGKSWHRQLSDKKWIITGHKFWTTPHAFNDMKQVSPDLYQELSQSDLVFFKGDLNYRKLVGDRRWEHTVPYAESLCGFHPAPVCALRTSKADVMVGLQDGVAEEMSRRDQDWMVKGEYGVIQYCGIKNI